MTPTPALLQRLARALEAAAAAAHAWRVLLALLVGIVSYLALTPNPPAGVDFGWDKLNHALAFAALAFTAHLGYPSSRRTRLLWLIALLAFGGLIELLQWFVPGRSSEWGDLLADSIGIACGALIAAWLLRAISTLASRPVERR
jgi:VanZ family protein